MLENHRVLFYHLWIQKLTKFASIRVDLLIYVNVTITVFISSFKLKTDFLNTCSDYFPPVFQHFKELPLFPTKQNPHPFFLSLSMNYKNASKNDKLKLNKNKQVASKCWWLYAISGWSNTLFISVGTCILVVHISSCTHTNQK